MSSLDYLDLCRLCLVKDRVSVPIFDGEGDVRQIFLKIAACLPVKVAREDKLPKKICDDCVYKVELFYQFWNTTANAEKQLLQWLGEVNLEDKQGYVTDVLNTDTMKDEQSTENRLDGNVIQHVGEHQNNMGMGMMDNMGLGIPIIISSANQQQITSVPMDTSGSSVQTVQAVPGPSSQTTHNQISQNRTSSTHQEDEEDTEDEENSDEECDGDDGLTVKEESEEEPSNRTVEPTTFVNVPLACDEAGPSGLQQQKISDIPELPMPQSADEDPKSECQEMIVEEPKFKRIRVISTSELMKYETEACAIDEFNTISHEEIVIDDSNETLAEDPLMVDAGTVQVDEIEYIYECDICKETLTRKQQYLKHKEKHARLDKIGNQCKECNKSFGCDEKLRKHLVKVHQQEKPFQCMLCEKRFKTEEYLKTHLKQHNKRFTCDICGISKVSGYDLRLHKKKHNGEYVTHCELCGKGFYTNQTLERHVITHTGEKPHVCKICNTSYASASYLSLHMKSHGEREKYKCNVCNFESYWKTALKVHLKIHTGENLSTCEVCGKSVSSKSYLQVHMRIHSGEKPHVCEVCGKAFSIHKYLIVHLRTHTGERPYECKVCQKKFTQQSSLNSHMKLHNDRK